MGSSVSRAITSWKQRKDRRCLLVGLDNSGKTTVLNTLSKRKGIDTVPTIGFNVETIKMKKLTFDIWDVGGQEKYRSMWRHYYTGTQGIILMVDASDRSRFTQVQKEFERMANDDQLKNAKWLIIANKQDLPNSAHSSELENVLNVKSILKDRVFYMVDAVATKDIGIREGFQWLEKQLSVACFCLLYHLMKHSSRFSLLCL